MCLCLMRRLQKLLKQERFLNIVSSNLNVAIGQALQEITIHHLKEFCVATDTTCTKLNKQNDRY
jgi:hypothetical protein